nr:MAG TPA: hypothetical protein [Caudoviricetes sp.]
MSRQRSFYCYQSIRLGGRFRVEYIVTLLNCIPR